MIELRWRRLHNTRDKLQWREVIKHSKGKSQLSEWSDVPIFVDEETENENKL